jgi:exosortase A
MSSAAGPHRQAARRGVRALPWRIALPVAIAAALGILGLYWDTAVSIAAIWWRSETYAHGMLLVPISLYMMWTRRGELLRLAPTPSPWGLAAIGALGAVWLVGHGGNVLVVQQLALVAMYPALVLALLGTRVAWAMAFPLAYLFFAVPMGEALVPPMQDLTAWLSVTALQLTGIPVYWEGRYISIPSGDFEVAEACSGVRYLIASLAVGCLYAYLSYRSPWRRIGFVALALIVPVLANGLRAYGIILLAHLSDMRIAIGVDHLIYGWVFFGLVMLLLFWLGARWREPAAAPPHPQGPLPALQRAARGRTTLLAGVAAVALAAAGPLAAQRMAAPAAPLAPLTLEAPAAPGGWEGPFAVQDDWQPRFAGAHAELHRVYVHRGARVHLYIVYYHHQEQGAKLVTSTNSVYDGGRWRRVEERFHRLDGAVLRETRMRSPQSQTSRLVWHWYDIGGHHTAYPALAKLFGAWSALRRDGTEAALFAVAADYDLRPDGARELLREFLADMGPALRGEALRTGPAAAQDFNPPQGGATEALP